MDKQKLVSTINKYHLGGLIETVKWKINGKTITIPFISPDQDLIGLISNPDFDLEDKDIAVYDTNRLLKLISITGQFIVLEIEKNKKINPKLLIEDNEYNLKYTLADPNIIPQVPDIDESMGYDIEFDLNKEFISNFIKAYKVIDSKNLKVESYYDENDGWKLKFILGENNDYSNKIELSLQAQIEIPGNNLLFKSDYFKEIFDNNKDLISGKGFINEGGLIKFEFINEHGVKSIYYIVAKDDM